MAFFEPGEKIAKISVEIIKGTVPEEDHHFSLMLSAPSILDSAEENEGINQVCLFVVSFI